MDKYMEAQIQNAVTSARLFEQACKMVALKDDTISKEEAKILRKINRIVNSYTNDLTNLLKKG